MSVRIFIVGDHPVIREVLWEHLVTATEPGSTPARKSVIGGPTLGVGVELRRRLAWSNSPVPGPSGEGTHILGTGIDVREQRRMEAALRQSESLREAGRARYEAEARLAVDVTISCERWELENTLRDRELRQR